MRGKKKRYCSAPRDSEESFKSCGLYLFYFAAISFLQCFSSVIALTLNCITLFNDMITFPKPLSQWNILRGFIKINGRKMLLFAVIMIIKRESKKKTTDSSSLVYLCSTCSYDERTVIPFIPGNRIAACLRITTAHAFPIASLVKINGEATALGKYTPVFSLVRATAISPSSSCEDRRPSFSSVEGEMGAQNARVSSFDENARLTPLELPIQSALIV